MEFKTKATKWLESFHCAKPLQESHSSLNINIIIITLAFVDLGLLHQMCLRFLATHSCGIRTEMEK